MSKFGTLLLMNKPLNLEYFNSVAIQTGRTVMSFTIKKTNNSKSNKIIESTVDNSYNQTLMSTNNQTLPS
jgi:hypothetical protein